MENDPTAYLSTAQKGEYFQPFSTSKHTAFVMPLGLYLSLLHFINLHWRNIDALMDKKIKVIKKLSFPKKCKKTFLFLPTDQLCMNVGLTCSFFTTKNQARMKLVKGFICKFKMCLFKLNPLSFIVCLYNLTLCWKFSPALAISTPALWVKIFS